MKYFTYLVLILTFFACSELEVVQFREMNLAKALETAKQSNKKVLIDFWADG